MSCRSIHALLKGGLPALFCLSLFAGCGTTRIHVPEDREIRLLEEDEPVTVTERRRIWFCLWGNVPISDDSPIPEIEEHNLREMRVTSQQTMADTALNILGGIVTVVCRTIVVEGNP